MTPTEITLLAVHKSPAIPLVDICDRYLGLGQVEAGRQAALHLLPFPTFKVSASRKAPIMVAVKDLAAHIDHAAECAKKEWQHSQV
jgi:hypothetical protein